MPCVIVRQDITKLKVDAVVNAANTRLQRGGGVCGAIFSAAGMNDLQAACDKLAPIKTGDAVITPGFRLPARYVIHAAGPIFQDGKQGEEALLRSAYLNSLKLARSKRCGSIAFPLISAGIYGYPKAQALRVALAAIRDFLADHEMDVALCVLNTDDLMPMDDLSHDLDAYIDRHFIPPAEQMISAFFHHAVAPAVGAAHIAFAPLPAALHGLMDKLDEPFAKTLLRLIDAKGKTDVEVYKRANIDRKLFSKIRKNNYMPGKKTVLALAVALELTLDETRDLLERAGFAFSHSKKFDVIVEYFIANGLYDIYEINAVLFGFDLELLGGS